MIPSAGVPPFDKIAEFEESCLRVALLRSALELGLFDAIAGGAATLDDIAHCLAVDRRALAIMLQGLCTQGFLDTLDGRYRLEPVADVYLVRGRESYYGRSCLELTLSFDVASSLTSTVRRGRPELPPGSSQGSGALWAADFSPDLALWPEKMNESRDMWRKTGIEPGNRVLRILDVACGPAIDSLTLLHDHPDARLVGLDLHPEVLEVTRRIARRMGVAERTDVRVADIVATASLSPG
jgi:C-methyltransferase